MFLFKGSLFQLFLRICLLFFLILIFIQVYDHVLFRKVPLKSNSEHIRIGFINLHQSKIPANDLKELMNYNCDLWLFLEWNGDNLDELPSFQKTYTVGFEEIDTFTYGMCILSKFADTKIREVGNAKRPYACDYPKHMIEFGKIRIFLVHAPPPVPTCRFETSKYIDDLLAIDIQDGFQADLIIGDLNTIPIQKAIRNIKFMGFADSYSSLHRLPVGTFTPSFLLPRVLKYDYVLHRSTITPKLTERFRLSSSDHTGYIADFALSRN